MALLLLCVLISPRGAAERTSSAVPQFAPGGELPQLAIPVPTRGQVVDRPISVQAVAIPSDYGFSQVGFWLQARQASQEDPILGVAGLDALPTQADGLLGPLLGLGVDRDGQDGWAAPLDPADWPGGDGYRILVVGTDPDGRTILGVGSWFRMQPQDRPWLRLRAGEPPVLRGTPALLGLAYAPETDAGRVALSVLPADEGPSDPGALLPQGLRGDVAYYAGEHLLGSSEPSRLRWGSLPLDSRRVPDGAYRAVISTTGSHGASASALVTVDNVISPQVEILYPLPGQVLEQVITAEVLAEDLDGTVERVAFFLQEVQEGEPDVGAVHRSVWLGTDLDGSDGWRVRRAVDATLDGDAWVLHVVATDDAGLSRAVRSAGSFAILGRPRPFLRFATPSGNVPLRGVRRVTVHAPVGYEHVERVQLLARNEEGALSPLGDMREELGRWTLDWRTNDLPDGTYSLLAVAHDAAGRSVAARSGSFDVLNRPTVIRFRGPGEGEELSGVTTVSIWELPGSEALGSVRLFYTGTSGQLVPIGEDREAEDGWSVRWDTSGVPDGEYELVAIGSGASGHGCRAAQQVMVRNHAPRVSLAPLSDDGLSGQVPVEWQVDHPLDLDVTVSIAYSPDGGQHWLEVADDLPGDGTYPWDTRAVPDSDEGLLRLVADDGERRAGATSLPFRLNNVNESPIVSFAAPTPHQVSHQHVHVAWQAWDPDGDELTIRLEYRRGGGAWMLLVEREAEPPFHRWTAADLPAGEQYSLRITATDPWGAMGMDIVEGVRLVANSRPTVQLLAPRGTVRLRDQAVVLWTASDSDADVLHIDLYYSDNGGLSWLPLAQDLPNTGYYVWQFSFLPSGTDYRLRIVACDGLSAAMDESDSPFTIGSETIPELLMRDPEDGAALTGRQMLSWQVLPAAAEERRIRVEVRPEGSAWLPVLSEAPDDGFWLWDTTEWGNGRYDLRVTALGRDGDPLAAATPVVTLANGVNRAPSVTLDSPQAGDVWSGLREVRWRAKDPDADDLTAVLQLSADAGATWRKLATVPVRAGGYLWDTRGLPPGNAYLLCIIVDDREFTDQARTPGVFHVVNQAGSPPRVSFIGLDDRETLPMGTRVLWTADDPDGDPLDVVLALSEDGGRTWRELARSGAGTSGHVLPELLCGRDNRLRLWADDGLYRVEVGARVDGDDALPGGCPELYVDAPTAGDVLSGFQEVRWRVIHPAELGVSVDLELSRDGGRSWRAVTEGFPNTGVYDLDTRAWPNGFYRLRVTARSVRGATVSESGAFRIDNPGNDAPVVSLLAPAGGESWAGVQEISWRVYDPDGDEHLAGLSYSVNGGMTWQEIATDVVGEPNVIWDTANAPNAEAVWLRVDVGDGRFSAYDVLDVPITIHNAESPTLTLHTPAGPLWTGVQRLAWMTGGGLSERPQVLLDLSTDHGWSWRLLAGGLPASGSYLWDTAQVPDGTRVLIRARATTKGRSAAMDAMERLVIVRGNAALLAATNPYAVDAQ